MDYIVLDLEWNQSNTSEKENKEIPFEIIEIGAVKLDHDKKKTSSFNQLIRPQVYPEMHSVTGKLLHLQMKELQKGHAFPETIRSFLDWCGKDVVYCTWGPTDLTELQRNMAYYHLPPLSERPLPFLDVQKLFSIAYEDGKSRRSLEYAIDFLNMEKDIPFHRAFSDAYYTAKILTGLDRETEKNVSFDLFVKPKTHKEEIHIVFDNYAKYISRIFPDKETALKDREVSSTKCYYCHKNLKRKIKWFTPNGKHYYSLSYCDRHGYMKGKIRVRKADEHMVYVVKTCKFISEEEAIYLRERRDTAKQIRRLKHTQKSKSSN